MGQPFEEIGNYFGSTNHFRMLTIRRKKGRNRPVVSLPICQRHYHSYSSSYAP